jgi:hypothetical protein
MRPRVTGTILGVALSLVVASSALATECVNASKKDQGAGAQIIFDLTDGSIDGTPGVLRRIDQGLIDLNTGEGFHGIIGLDADGDGDADVSTWFGVGPEGDEIPDNAQFNGPACRGITNIETYFTECLGS